MAHTKNLKSGVYSYVWTKEKINQLIKLYKTNTDLWQVDSENYMKRVHKQKLQLEMAEILDIDVKHVICKIHNLRCQYNAELRKINQGNHNGSDEVYIPRWEYYDALQFLSKAKNSEYITLNLVDNSTLASNESIDSKSDEKIIDLKSNDYPIIDQNDSFRMNKSKRKSDSQEDAILNSSMTVLSKSVDSQQIFGDYIADQMRGMTANNCKRLKIIIQKAIVQIQEESLH